jgi:ubiquinone/menaquinone biosynthesis C-methylase UbiE
MHDRHTSDSISNYNKIAKDYDNTFDGRFTKDLKEKLVDNAWLDGNARVLDVACANGSLLRMLNEKNPIEGYGIDISDEMIKTAMTAHPSFVFSVSNSSKLDFGDSFFDAITVCAAFHHFSEPARFLQEAKRVLKNDGSLFIMEPYFNPVIRALFNMLIPIMKMGDVKVYGKKEMRRMIDSAGLITVDYSRQTGHGCLYIARKP